MFTELVDACTPDHFRVSDEPLLISFVQATLLSRQAVAKAATDSAALTLWEKATKMQATLATRLRLSPQTRLDPKTVARRRPEPLKMPWED